MRQLPETETAQNPLNCPFSGCRFNPGKFISGGLRLASSLAMINLRRFTCSGLIPWWLPVSYNFFRPLCLKLFIIFVCGLESNSNRDHVVCCECNLIMGRCQWLAKEHKENGSRFFQILIAMSKTREREGVRPPEKEFHATAQR